MGVRDRFSCDQILGAGAKGIPEFQTESLVK